MSPAPSPDRRPAILFVEPSPYASYGGSKRVLVHLATGLDPDAWAVRVLFVRQGPWVGDLTRRGVPVTVAAELAGATPPADDAPAGVSGRLLAAGVTRTATGEPKLSWPRHAVRELRGAMRMHWSDPRAARKLLPHAKRPLHLIHFNGGMHSDWTWYHLAKLRRVPFVLHEHGLWRAPAGAWRVIAREAASVLCLTHERMERVRAFCGGNVRVDLLPNGVPREAFGPFAPPEATRVSLGLAPGEALLVTAGHLQAWKGQDLAVEAAHHLASAGIAFRWLLCGSTVEPAFEQKLRERIRTLGLERRVVLAGQRADLANLFAAADLAVHTSVQPEPFGMVVVEAMAARTAVVAPAEGALPDIVRDGVDGRLVPPRDAAALGETLATLLADRAALERMGAAACERASETFRLEAQVRTLAGIYRRILTRG